MSSKPTAPVDQPEDAREGAVTEQPSAGARPVNPAEGWSRGRIVWGKPPQEAFRAGPLPRDEGMARLMAMPPHPRANAPKVSGSIASGVAGEGDANQNIPLAQKPAAQAATPAPQPARPSLGNFTNVPQARPKAAPTPSAPVGGGLFGTSLVPPAKPAQPQTPPVSPVEAPVVAAPVAAPVATSRPVVEEPAEKIHELPPVVAKRRPVAAEPAVETAPVKAASSPSKAKWLLVGGSVVVLAAAALWWMNRSEVPAPQALPEIAAPDMTGEAPIEAAPVQTDTAPVVTEPRPAPVEVPPTAKAPAPAPRSEPRPEPVRQEPARPVAQPAVRTAPVTQEPAATPPAPVIVVTPPKAEEAQTPPPAARPIETDPNAPMTTNPYKRD